MLRQSFLKVVLSLSLIAGAFAPATADELPQDPQQTVAELPEGQTLQKVEGVNSEETNTVEESAIAHKMTQAEKNQNAKENDSWGGAITITAMVIVLSALIILSILFLGFGKISSWLLSRKKLKAHGIKKDEVGDDHEDVDSGEAIAAIAAALAEHFSTEHDMEDTILTIRRLRKAYSPWNSKIYNMRHLPDLHHRPTGK